MPSFFKALKALQARFTTPTTESETASASASRPSTQAPRPAVSSTPMLIHRLAHKKEPSVSVASSVDPAVLPDSPALVVTASPLEKPVIIGRKPAARRSTDVHGRPTLSSFFVPHLGVPLVPVTQCITVGTLAEKSACVKALIAEEDMEKTVRTAKETAFAKVHQEAREVGEEDPFANVDEEIHNLEAIVEESKASHEEWSAKMRGLLSLSLDEFEGEEDSVTAVRVRSPSPASCSDYSMDATEVSFSSTVTVCVSPTPVLKYYDEEEKPLWA